MCLLELFRLQLCLLHEDFVRIPGTEIFIQSNLPFKRYNVPDADNPINKTDSLSLIHCRPFFGKIQTREFAEQSGSSPVVGLRGVDFIAEVAEVVGFVVAGYLGDPFVVSFVPVDAFEF